MNIGEFEIEKTWEALTELGPRSAAAQLSSLTLLITACIWTFGANSSNEVEVPILGIGISTKVAAELAVLLGAASYFLVNIFNSYRVLLERRLQELIQVHNCHFRLTWNCKYPAVTTYLSNIRGLGKVASLVSFVLIIATFLVPLGLLLLLFVLGSSWYMDRSFWLLAAPSAILLILGFSVFCSSRLTPHH